MNEETNYPLKWPLGWKRSRVSIGSRFGKWNAPISMARAVEALENELRLLPGRRWIISTNVKVKQDGTPYANQRRPDDPGVAVYFTMDANNRRVALACDKWNRPEDNLYAIAKHIEAMRGQNRWGVGSLEQAFTGYMALEHRTEASCWEILGITAEATEAEILAAWKQNARKAHPDAGGSTEEFAKINQAKDIAIATLKGRK